MQEENKIFCVFSPFDGNFKISILADDFIVLGADFKILKTETKEVIENWKFSADKGKSAYYDLLTLPQDLHKCSVYWNILCCSRNPNKFMGRVQIKIMQGNKTLKTTTPTSYNLRNLPPCQLNGSEEFSGNFTFINNSQIKNSN